jgi:Holliday junction resolvasome RuvABC endonuclease subunit
MQNRHLRIIALDVAFTHLGASVLEYDTASSTNWDVLSTTCLVTKPEAKKRHSYETDDKVRRVRILCKGLATLIEEWEPLLVAAELPSSGGKSAAAHASMGIAISVVTCVTELLDIPMRSYNWDDIKLKVTGKKTAGKKEIQEAIVKLYPALGVEHKSTRKDSKTGYTGNFEHIADSIGAAMCAMDSDVVEALIRARS